MKEKRKEIPVQRVEPDEGKTSYKIAGWTAFLACILLLGGVSVLQKSWGDLAPSVWMTGGMAVAEILICILGKWLQRRYAFAWIADQLPWLILLIWGTPVRCLNGAKEWLDLMSTRWNFAHNGGTAVFVGSATKKEILVVSLLAALLLGQAVFKLTESHSHLAGIFFCTLLIAVEVTGDTFDPIASSFLIIALLGMNMSDAGTMVTRTCLRWIIGIGALLFAGAVFLPNGEVESIRQLRENTKQAVHEIRYGKDSLPKGELGKAAKLKESEVVMLEVQSEQEKSMYLRGFVGSVYEGGVWKETEDSAYGGENAGMLRWLKQNHFDPQTQVATYYELGEDENAPESNRVRYKIEDASRYYVYLPSSIKEVTDGRLKEKKDTRYVSRGFIAGKGYEIEEVSGSRPSELMVADGWVSDPQTDLQKEYCEAESVYRQFVYDNYTKAEADLADLIDEVFWQDYETENDGIYSALSHIREILKEKVQYTDAPAEAPEGADPVRYFLNGSHQGNAMLYATTAVEALRLHGIPARYVEGYYLSENAVADSRDTPALLSGKDAHAWAEVYFDGIGWLPVDVTPGYYYEAVALQQMVGTPDIVRKTASVNNNSFEANQLTGENGTASKKQENFRVAKKTMRILLGIVAVFLMLLVIIFALAEVVRVLAAWLMKKEYDRTAGEEQVRRAELIIRGYLGLWGIEAHLGWNTEETDRKIAEKTGTLRRGEYCRVCELLEKTIYGEEELEEYEKRTLNRFMKKLTGPGEKCNLKMRINLRYACFKFLGM